MIVCTLLPRELAARVVEAFGKENECCALDVRTTSSFDNARGAHVVIVDPALFVREPAFAASDLVAAIDPSRIVAYSAPSADSILGTVELTRSGVRHVVVDGMTDTALALERVVRDVLTGALVERLIKKVEPQLELLPRSLAQAVAEGLRRPYEYRDVGGVCAAANLPRRSCDRALARAGLSYLSRLLRAARVVRAAHWFRDKNLKASAIAARTGSSSERQLAAEVRQVIGTSPTAFRTMSDDIILERVMRYIQAP
jgi:AraC-like DNA-binding protein